MGEVHYMISEAAKRVDVEAHVLRYWEEELEIPIERTEMGHRYYTEENVQLFKCIKELKEQGLMLKELKEMIPEMLRVKHELEKREEDEKTELAPAAAEEVFTGVFDENAERIQNLFSKIVQDVMLENNKVLEEQVSKSVSEKVMKEMDYLLQAKERQEEERFQKLDHLIRQQQSMRKEAAKPVPVRKLRKIFGTN